MGSVPSSTALSLRPAGPADETAVRRLAERDGASMPPRPWLLAESGGRILAAGSLSNWCVVADPFVPSAHPAEMLARQIRHCSGAGATGRPARSSRGLARSRHRFA